MGTSNTLLTDRKETQRPITADEVGDGRLLVQIIFNHQGTRFVWNGIGDAISFVTAKSNRGVPVRKRFVWTIVAAACSAIAAAYGLEPAEMEPDPEVAGLISPN